MTNTRLTRMVGFLSVTELTKNTNSVLSHVCSKEFEICFSFCDFEQVYEPLRTCFFIYKMVMVSKRNK